MSKSTTPNRYEDIISKLFFDKYKEGMKIVPFTGTELKTAFQQLGIKNPDNIPDVIYSFRFRYDLPQPILDTQPKGKEWIIELNGRAKGESHYKFRLGRINRITPNPSLVTIKIPDATPEIISANAKTDEQALLAKVRYNRLMDIFLGVTTYSLQNHLRTTVKGIGQIEIDEIYVGVDKQGRQYVIPVQAKGVPDKISVVQVKQDIACCAEKFQGLICRAISTQFMEDEKIAIFELTLDEDDIQIVEERHYKLVPNQEISAADLETYATRSS